MHLAKGKGIRYPPCQERAECRLVLVSLPLSSIQARGGCLLANLAGLLALASSHAAADNEGNDDEDKDGDTDRDTDDGTLGELPGCGGFFIVVAGASVQKRAAKGVFECWEGKGIGLVHCAEQQGSDADEVGLEGSHVGLGS